MAGVLEFFGTQHRVDEIGEQAERDRAAEDEIEDHRRLLELLADIGVDGEGREQRTADGDIDDVKHEPSLSIGRERPVSRSAGELYRRTARHETFAHG